MLVSTLLVHFTGDTNMEKLLNAFATDKADLHASRLVEYVRKHPMCVCMMTPEQLDLYREAERYFIGSPVY